MLADAGVVPLNVSIDSQLTCGVDILKSSGAPQLEMERKLGDNPPEPVW